ncbi:glutathione binding-like protein [Motiliproteus sp. SC1-56]|uniref:glutathione binding-like protein n=1 Tax=Motiliproteus sp. SC1-56 TaxID=2799565 RepID=UPI001A8DBD54|nr:glutathione binding-like protein [Motiliproteus sp. SC1-56]
MIDLYFWTTPNGYKPLILLEELKLDYRLVPVDIGKGEQFEAGFLKIAPNNRIPALVDHDPADGGAPISIFESGAILEYLADRQDRLLPRLPRPRFEVLQWLYWQMGGLGPMAGQNHHFTQYAPEKIPYAIKRYVDETARLYAVMNRRLADRDYLAGEYSIADIACYPWVASHEKQQQDLNDFPHLRRWFEAIALRPAVTAAYTKGRAVNSKDGMSDEAKKLLFGQNASSIR